MTKPKKWTPGVADEVWKVVICGRDAAQADRLLQGLVYILTDAGSDFDRGVAEIRKMSGDQIASALINYQRSAIESVRRALQSERSEVA